MKTSPSPERALVVIITWRRAAVISATGFFEELFTL